MTTGIDPTSNGHEPQQTGYRDFGEMNFLGNVEFPGKAQTETGGSSYSDFPHKMAELLRTIRGVVMHAKFEDRREKLLCLRLYRIFERDWTAEVTNRQALIDEAEKRAGDWKVKMAQEAQSDVNPEGTPPDTVQELLRQWNTCASFLAEAYVQKKQHGLAHVRRVLRQEREIDGRTVIRTARDRLDEAREDMEKVRFSASALPPAHAQYFWASLQSLRLSIERNVDLALGIPVVDYTDVKKDLANGANLQSVIDRMPWAFREIDDRVFMSLTDGEIWDFLTTNQIQQWPYDRRPPRQGKRGFLGFGPRGDEDDEDEDDNKDYDERTPDRRRSDRRRQQQKQRGGRRRK